MLAGTICIIMPWLMPYGFFIYIVWYGMTIMGIMMFWIGPILLIMRAVGTHAHLLLPLPKANEVLSIHERRGGHGTLRRGMVDALEHIRMKDMIFKDTGGGTRIAGHRVIKTMETVNHNIPDWTAQYLYNIREKYMVESPEKLKALHIALVNLRTPVGEYDTIEQQLTAIPETKAIMLDPKYAKKKKQILQIPLGDLRNMAEMLYHGQVIHFEDYERFQDAASPYDMESYTKRREIHRMMQMTSYKDIMQQDYFKYIIVFGAMLILGAIAYTIFAG